MFYDWEQGGTRGNRVLELGTRWYKRGSCSMIQNRVVQRETSVMEGGTWWHSVVLKDTARVYTIVKEDKR